MTSVFTDRLGPGLATSVSTDRRRGVNSGMAVKVPCRVATTANITLSGEQTIDGVAVVADDRVLVKNQTDATENGIYVADSGDWSRAPDCDGANDLVTGTLVKVNLGTVGQGFYYVSTVGEIVVGTDAVAFTLASSVLAAVSAFMQTVLDDTTSNAALTTLTTTRSETGAAAVPVLTKLRENVTVDDFDGATFTARLTAALASGAISIRVVNSGTLTAQVTIPASVMLWTDTRAVITKGFNGDMFNMSASGCRLFGLVIAGAGATFTGRGIVISSSNFQEIDSCFISDMNGYCVEFTADDAGGHCIFKHTSFSRTTVLNPNIKLPTLGTPETSGNRNFINCQSLGGNLMDLADSTNTRIWSCSFAGLTMTSQHCSRAILSANRMAILSGTLTVGGFDHNITGNVIAGDIVLSSTSARCVIGPNNLLAGSTVTDSSVSTGTAVNEVYNHRATGFVPTWKGDVSDPAIGNGSLSGSIYRNGRLVTVNISLGIGGTTTFGSGAWYFQLPAPYNVWNAKNTAFGVARGLDNGTAFRVGAARVVAGTSKIYIESDGGASQWQSTTPHTWASTDTLELTITFEIA